MSNTEIALSKESIETLESLYTINQSLRIVANKNELKTINQQKTTVAYTSIDEVFDRDLNIYDLREFITVLNIIKDPVLDVSDEKFIIIKSATGSQKLRYADAEPSLIQSYIEKDVKLPSSDITVEIPADTLKSVQKAAHVLNLPFIGFVVEDGIIYFKAFAKNNGDENETNGYSEKVGETEEEFEAFYQAKALDILSGDCVFTLSKRKISQVETGKTKFFISMDPKSEFK